MSGENVSADAAADRIAIGALLGQIESTLRLMAAAGCREAQCSPDKWETAASWGDSDCLLPATSVADIAALVAACARCSRCREDTGRLAGYGSPAARLMFVGGWPSVEAADAGSPMAGPDGELLEKIIAAMKLSPETVYITHVVKCALPAGQVPAESESTACKGFLEQEIKAVAPDVICSLGDLAARTLLETKSSFAEQRGRFHDRGEISVLPTWHPADILLRRERKREVWEDVQKIMHVLAGS